MGPTSADRAGVAHGGEVLVESEESRRCGDAGGNQMTVIGV